VIFTSEIIINSCSIILTPSHKHKNRIPTKSPLFKAPVRESLAWSTSKRTSSSPSRLTYEKRSTIEVLFFLCFRFLADTVTDLAFPTPDDAVHDYLVKASVTDDQHTLKTNYLKFLGNVFRLVNGELDKCHEELRGRQITTAEGLAKWWSNHLQGTLRTKLYKAAINGTSEAIEVSIREDGEKYLVSHCFGRFFQKSRRSMRSYWQNGG